MKSFLERLHDLVWPNAIHDARRGHPQELANLLTKEGAVIPDQYREDVRNVIANPVHARRDGGRPPKYSEAQRRELREIWAYTHKGIPAGADYDAVPAMTRAQRSQLRKDWAARFGVSEKSLAAWGCVVDDPKPKAKRKEPSQVISTKR